MVRGDVKCNGLEHHAGYSRYGTTAWNPDGTGVTCKSKRPADAGGTATFCRRETCKRWWNWCGLRAQDLQVLLVRRQRGQSCLCENLAKYCFDSSLSRSDEIFSFVTTEQIVCKWPDRGRNRVSAPKM